MSGRQDQLAQEYKLAALRYMYPGASGKRISKLLRLSAEKGVSIVPPPKRTENLDHIMCSIIRHEESTYESALSNGVSKEDARGLISPIIRERMREMTESKW
jgi:hypothetical protein